MANKRPMPEEIVTKLREVELLPKGERSLCGLQPQHFKRQVKGRRNGLRPFVGQAAASSK